MRTAFGRLRLARLASAGRLVLRQWWLGALVAVVTVVVAPIFIVEILGVRFAGADSDRRFVAILTLAGVMVTALVSLIGMITARQSDRRMASHRAAEEMRLRLDAAMRAGELLNAGPSSHADPASVASGLLALTRLDRADLAVALLIDLWDCGHQPPSPGAKDVPAPQVTNETAVLVLDAALTSGNARAQLVAASLLCRNAFRLDICGPLDWPPSIDGAWDERFGPRTKLLLVDALVQQALHSEKREDALRSLTARLIAVAHGDRDRHVRGCVGTLLEAVSQPVTKYLEEGGTIMQGPLEVDLRDLKWALKRAGENPDRLFGEITKKRAARLRVWARECAKADPDPDPPAGALACAPALTKTAASPG